MFAKKNIEATYVNEKIQKNMLDNVKENIEKLSDQEKVEIKEHLENSLKDYEIARLKEKLIYADDMERVKIKRKLNNLLDRDNLEDYEY